MTNQQKESTMTDNYPGFKIVICNKLINNDPEGHQIRRHTASIYYDHHAYSHYERHYERHYEIDNVQVDIYGVYQSVDSAERKLREVIRDDIGIYITQEGNGISDYVINSYGAETHDDQVALEIYERECQL